MLTQAEADAARKINPNTLNSIPNSLTLYNGANLNLKNCYGGYQKPIHSNMWFVDDNTIVFIISNYIALFNIQRQTTSYLGINKVVGEVTAFYSCKNTKKTQKQAFNAD